MKIQKFNFITVLYDEAVVHIDTVNLAVSALDKFYNNNCLVDIDCFNLNFDNYKRKYKKLIYINNYYLNSINTKQYIQALKYFDEVYEIIDSNKQFYINNKIPAKKLTYFNYVSIEDLKQAIRCTLDKIPKDCDVIAGVPRSGMLPATIIALYLNKRLTTVDDILNNKIFSCGLTNIRDLSKEPVKKVLIVEDSINSGNSINICKEKLYSSNLEFVYYSAIVKPSPTSLVDIYSSICTMPRIFEWNLFKHSFTTNAFVDIDGVLCKDPTMNELTEPEEYENYIKTAQCLVGPDTILGTVITNRLEKYRAITEEWLHKNKIQYKQLIMSQYNNVQERRKSNAYGKYKGITFKNSSSEIFIESSEKQAQEIADISQKTVICTDTNKIIYPSIF